MIIFRCEVRCFLVAWGLIVLSACGDNSQQKEIDDLRKQVGELQAQVENDQAGAEASDDGDRMADSVTAAPVTVPKAQAVPYEDLSNRLAREKLERDVADLKRQADLDRMNRDIERRQAEAEQRKRDRNRLLGIDY